MRLISVNVGLPREVIWNGKTVMTGIFKSSVPSMVALRRHNLDGDQQADLSVHGGPTKAVYVYPSQHYAYWRGELPGTELSWGNFGENLYLLKWGVYGGTGVGLILGYILAGSMLISETPDSYDCVECGRNLDFHDDCADEDEEEACSGDLAGDEETCDCEGWVSGPTSRGFSVSPG